MTAAREKLIEGFGFAKGETDADGNLIAKGELKRGLKFGDVLYKQFVMRAANAGDLFAAEQHVSPEQPLKFNAALWVHTVSFAGFDGAVTVAMFGKLSQADYGRLRTAQQELDLLGEFD